MNERKHERSYQEDVEGAPFKIGDKVRVKGTTLDDSFDEDETLFFTEREVTGTIYQFRYDLNCGESYPHDPCIHVSGTGTWFWKEELELALG